MVVIKSVKRALDILSQFGQLGSTLGVSQIAQALMMNKATVARVMATLELAGFVKKQAGSRKYRLDGKIGELAHAYLSGIDLKEAAHPCLEELHNTTNETVSICVREGDKRYFFDWIESSGPVRYTVEYHPYGPLHAGAPGKLLLAYLPDHEIESIINRTGLPGYTDITITNFEELKEGLKQIREEGFALSRGEHLEHVSTISVPVRNFTGNVIASLNISWVIFGDTAQKEKRYLKIVKKVADELSRQLGCYL